MSFRFTDLELLRYLQEEASVHLDETAVHAIDSNPDLTRRLPHLLPPL